MHARMLPLGLMSLLFVTATAFGQRPTIQPAQADGRQAAPAEVTYASRKTLARGVTRARLTSGLTVLVQENHSAPVATVRCYLHNTGSAFEGEDLGAGLSHVLEHLVAGGTTKKRTETQIREIVDSLGGQTNAYTSDSVTCFYIDCPSSGVSVAIELIADNMQNSVIPEAEYKREMGVVQRELEMGEADRTRVLYNSIKQLLYTEHPVRHPTIGYLSVVQQITREQVFAFYKNRYVPQNMTFVVAGDVKTDDVLDTILAMFKTFHRTTERYDVLPDEPEQASPRSTRIEMEGPTVNYAVAWPTVMLQHPDLYALDVLSFILSNGDSSRLVRKLRVEKPLAINVSTMSNTPGFVRGWFQVTAEAEPKNIEEVRQIISAEIERLKTEPVSDSELAKAKRQKAADHVFQQQTVENQAEMLSESFRSTGDPLFDAQYVSQIQKVTPAQIQEVAKRYFIPERINTLSIEPVGSGAKADEDAEEEAETPIVRKVLPNGLVVLLKRQTALPMVTIQAYARAGALADTTATSGLASITTEMLDQGTKKYKADQISQYFDSIGGTLQLSSQMNTSYLQSAVLKDDATTTLNYIYQVLFEPTFPDDEFAKVQEIRLGRIASRKANPQAEIMDFAAKQVPAANPYSRTATGDYAAVERLKAADCRKFHKTWFVPNNMVLSVFGDIDPATVLKQIEGSFGKVPRADKLERPSYPDQQPPLSAGKVAHLQNQKKNTAMVFMAFPTVSVKDEQTRATLDVLDAILTGGGSAGGRLHEELRGEQLVYYVFGIQMSGFAPGYFAFLAQTRPESVPEVVKRIRENLDRIAKEGIPSDEFEKAKAKLVIAHALRNTTPVERAFQASVDELYGLGYDYEKSYPERIGKVTVEDVVAAVKKHFGHGLTVTTSPEEAPELGSIVK